MTFVFVKVRLICEPFLYRSDRFFLVYVQAFHQPSELLRCQFFQLAFIPRPLILSCLQPFIQQDISVVISIQTFDSILLSAAKQKQ